MMTLSDMTLEQKAGQLLIAHFNGEELNDAAERLLSEVHVGGVIYYYWANGLKDPLQVQKLSRSLQERSVVPLFIGIDQEGGRVTHLQDGFTHFYGNGALGIAGDFDLAEEAGLAMGHEMRAVGINLDFAPVVDVNNAELNPVVGQRSFGSSPEKVALFGKRMLQGFHRAGILGTLKHFPGHGDVAKDSHFAIPLLDKSKEHLMANELVPFKELLNETDMIMTGHLRVSAIDPDHCTTFSKAVLQELLREEMGYQGVIVSDSLMMEGLMEEVNSVDEAVLRAFEAGCDLLLLGGKRLFEGQDGYELTVSDIARIHQRIVDEVKSGRIAEERLNASVERVLKLKNTLSFPVLSEKEIKQYVGTEEHLQLANRIFDRSLRCAKPRQPID